MSINLCKSWPLKLFLWVVLDMCLQKMSSGFISQHCTVCQVFPPLLIYLFINLYLYRLISLLLSLLFDAQIVLDLAKENFVKSIPLSF